MFLFSSETKNVSFSKASGFILGPTKPAIQSLLEVKQRCPEADYPASKRINEDIDTAVWNLGAKTSLTKRINYL
jgi:uncharacterized protein (UPF0254 family)